MTIRTSRNRSALTLLELIISMSLLIVLVAMLWSLIQFYTTYYQAGVRRSDRSQVVRSLSQLLNEDLGAAIQDPIHPLPPSLVAEDTVRRFGLWGDSHTLRIDLVQINPLDPAEKKKVQRQAAVGLVPDLTPQVPELKTVFYQFVPLSEYRSNDPEIRCGLTRQEINFETPVKPGSTSADNAEFYGDGSGNVLAVTRAVGTNMKSATSDEFSDTPDWATRDFGVEKEAVPEEENRYTNKIAEQLFRNTDNESLWAPEVVDCRFRYCDGTSWVDSWDSLQRNGLPTAVEVTLKLMPLEEVEKLRKSPTLLARLETPKPGEESDENRLDTVRGAGTLPVIAQEYPLEMSEDGFPSSAPVGAVRNETLTLEMVTQQLELSVPFQQRIVTYLATSPLLKSTPIVRAGPPPKKPVSPPPVALPEISLPSPQPPPPPPIAPPKSPGQQWIRG